MTAPVTSAVASEEALRNAITATTEQIANKLIDFYRDAAGFLHAQDQAAEIARIAEQVAPLVEAGQLNVAELVNARLSDTFKVAEPPPVSAANLGRIGVDRRTEYARPLWSAVQASRKGASDADALAVAARRVKQQVGTDMQMARVKQSREVVRRSRYRHYRRVANPGACPLCRIASTQLYHSEDLLPIHGGTCRCGVEPVEDWETQEDLDRALDTNALADADDQKKMLGQAVEDGEDAAGFRDMVAVREHSETGPTLTWKHQKFQTAEELGRAATDIELPTATVKHYRAYDADAEWPSGSVSRDEMTQSVKDNGIQMPLTIRADSRHGILEDGNRRLVVADSLGIEQLPVRVRKVDHAGLQAVPLEPKVAAKVGGKAGAKPLPPQPDRPEPYVGPKPRPRPRQLFGMPAKLASDPAAAQRHLWAVEDPPKGSTTLRYGETWYPTSTVTTKDGKAFERANPGIVTSMHPGLEQSGQKGFLRGVGKMHRKFPNVRIDAVEVDHRGGDDFWAATHYAWPAPGEKDRRIRAKIVLNSDSVYSDAIVGDVRAASRDYADIPFHLRRLVGVREGVKTDPYEAAAVHEFGHALSAANDFRARTECKRILNQEYMNGRQASIRGGKETFGEWFDRTFPSYARTSTGEMLAEAFADVEINGRKRANRIFVRIHDMMVDQYNYESALHGLPEAVGPYAKADVGHLPKPQAKSPVDIVDAAQTRRAAKVVERAEKAAARAAAQAEKAAAKAAKAAERETAKRVKAARVGAAKRTRKATSVFDRQYKRLQAQRAAEAARAAKAAAAEADLRSLAGDRPAQGLTPREVARRVMASTPHVYTDRSKPPGPTSWVDAPSKEERAAALTRRIPEMKRNRLQRYSEIPDSTKVAGRRWYPLEGSLGRNTAIDAGLEPIYGTGCGAAFSVRTDIKWNRGYQTQFFAMTGGQRMASSNVDFTPTTMTSNLNRAKDVIQAPPTREGILAALQRRSPSPKLSNYFPSLEGDRTAHTADTWDGRVGDHSAAQIREALGLPPGTRLTDKQEAYGEKLLNVEEFGYHWRWVDKKGQWEPVPNYTAADKINDNYEAFKASGVQAAAEAPKFRGRYESILDPATGHYRAVLVDDSESDWDPRDLQAALWIHIRNGTGS